jgi:hypothetical protein
MEIKGTAVKSIAEYVKSNFTDKYGVWYKALPDQSKEIIDNISSAKWYPLNDAAVVPTRKIGEVFFDFDTKKGAWESGRHSANVALNGVYKLYVKMSSPGHIIARAGRIIAAYYNPSKMEVVERNPKSVKLSLTNFENSSDVIEYRIAGWMQRALEISGCKDVEILIPQSLTRGDNETIFECRWSDV